MWSLRFKDLRSTLMLVFVTLIALTNFFAPFFNHDYKTDPLVTYAFMGLASSIVGYKGVHAFIGRGRNHDPKREDAEP